MKLTHASWLAVLGLAFGGAASTGSPLVPRVRPTSHDFGDYVLGVPQEGKPFVVWLSAGDGPTDSVTTSLTGPDAGDFQLVPATYLAVRSRDCELAQSGSAYDSSGNLISGSAPLGLCLVHVRFLPRTLGPKTATLNIYTRGGSGTATLKGNGVPGCRYEIVHCNYGALYSGTVSWSSTLNYSASSANQKRRTDRSVSVTATITNGMAICAGAVTENRSASGDEALRGWLRATVGGSGMFAVEFDKDAQGKLYYLVTIACPSEAGTDSTENQKTGTKDGNTISATLAEIDGREMQSDKQPATRVGMNLSGRITFRHPDEDPVNGVSGTVTVTWALNSATRPPPP